MNMMTTIDRPLPPIALLRALPPGPLAREHRRLKQLAELFAAFDRDDMEAGVDLLLASLDAMDGDPDSETNGDELDGDGSEDDFMNHGILHGAGCPVADAGHENGIGIGDGGWTEWNTRGHHKLDRFGAEIVGRDRVGNLLLEDEEDDDPAEIDDQPEDDDPAEAAGDEEDGELIEDDFLVVGRFGAWVGAGCLFSDPPEDDYRDEPSFMETYVAGTPWQEMHRHLSDHLPGPANIA